jgi:hypothetical protein
MPEKILEVHVKDIALADDLDPDSLEPSLIIDIGDEFVRFTPDGRVFVLDAIELMCACDRSHDIWERMKMEHPDILKYCEDYGTQQGDCVSVTAIEGWEKIWKLLPEYLFDPNLA